MERSSDKASRATWQIGDREEDFQSLFTRYFRPLFRFFTSRGLSHDESLDLIQETYLRVYRGISEFRGDASFETWLFQIAINLWRKELRRRMAAKRKGTETPLDASIGAENLTPVSEVIASRQPASIEDMLARERIRLLQEALAELPPQMRRCVTLHVGQGLKYREIATAMGISIDTVKSQISQAKNRLRERLAEHFSEIELG